MRLILRNPDPAVSSGRMNPARSTAGDDIDSLGGSPVVVSATEAARVQPDRPAAPAHDSFTRLLHRGVSWFEAEWGLVRDAVREYPSNPRYRLPPRATA